MEKNLEDIALIQNILEGDKKSEKLLYEKYKKILNDYIKNKYPQNFEYEDDISEILIKIFLSLSKYDVKKSKFKTWVFNITKNYMIDKSRCNFIVDNISSGTYKISDNFDTITYQNMSSTTTNITHTNYNGNNYNITLNDGDYNTFENQTSINFISDQLDSCDFTFLNMHYLYGYSYCEIGDEFNVSSNTISNRVNYIKNKLKKCNNGEIIF